MRDTQWFDTFFEPLFSEAGLKRNQGTCRCVPLDLPAQNEAGKPGVSWMIFLLWTIFWKTEYYFPIAPLIIITGGKTRPSPELVWIKGEKISHPLKSNIVEKCDISHAFLPLICYSLDYVHDFEKFLGLIIWKGLGNESHVVKGLGIYLSGFLFCSLYALGTLNFSGTWRCLVLPFAHAVPSVSNALPLPFTG